MLPSGEAPGFFKSRWDMIKDLGKEIISPFTGFSSVGDAIIRPNGEVIETDPKDTLIATKNGIGGGITLIVQGSLIGLDSEDISRSLSDQLNAKLSL